MFCLDVATDCVQWITCAMTRVTMKKKELFGQKSTVKFKAGKLKTNKQIRILNGRATGVKRN